MAGQLIKPPVIMPISNRPISQQRDLSNDDWFSPLEPLAPAAPIGTQPRQFEYLQGQNLIWTPRASEVIGFNDLIYMADNCDLVRIVIESLKDQVCQQEWQVRVRRQPGETERSIKARENTNPRVQFWSDFLSWPNPEQCWADFARMVLEDLLVTDAPSILLQRTRGKKIGALRCIDGTTINRVVDKFGFTPQPPDTAYQQVLYGQPAVNLTSDDLVYRPRNPRARKMYGFGPVEQILLTLNIVLRRMRFQLNAYTEGNVPEALYTMPGNVTEDNVRKFQGWFDQQLQGNLGARRRIWFIPGDDKGVQRLHWTKEQLITDGADEWFARLVCYAFRLSPMEFVRMMNRATAAESQDVSQDQGVSAVCMWFADTINYIIQRKAGDRDVEFTFAQKREPDVLKQAQADKTYVDSGIRTRNEVRENLGDDPSPDPQADVLGVTTAQGFLPLDQILISNQMQQQESGQDPSADGASPNGREKAPVQTESEPAPKGNVQIK